MPKNAVEEPFSLSIISGIEEIWMRGWGGVLRYSIENSLSHSAENHRWATLQGVTNFEYRKPFCFRGLCHDFLLKFFCLTKPKNFVGEPFGPSLMSGIVKFYASEGYVTIFCRSFFVSQSRKVS